MKGRNCVDKYRSKMQEEEKGFFMDIKQRKLQLLPQMQDGEETYP